MRRRRETCRRLVRLCVCFFQPWKDDTTAGRIEKNVGLSLSECVCVWQFCMCMFSSEDDDFYYAPIEKKRRSCECETRKSSCVSTLKNSPPLLLLFLLFLLPILLRLLHLLLLGLPVSYASRRLSQEFGEELHTFLLPLSDRFQRDEQRFGISRLTLLYF